jgi:hypothetical protein
MRIDDGATCPASIEVSKPIKAAAGELGTVTARAVDSFTGYTPKEIG